MDYDTIVKTLMLEYISECSNGTKGYIKYEGYKSYPIEALREGISNKVYLDFVHWCVNKDNEAPDYTWLREEPVGNILVGKVRYYNPDNKYQYRFIVMAMKHAREYLNDSLSDGCKCKDNYVIRGTTYNSKLTMDIEEVRCELDTKTCSENFVLRGYVKLLRSAFKNA